MFGNGNRSGGGAAVSEALGARAEAGAAAIAAARSTREPPLLPMLLRRLPAAGAEGL